MMLLPAWAFVVLVLAVLLAVAGMLVRLELLVRKIDRPHKDELPRCEPPDAPDEPEASPALPFDPNNPPKIMRYAPKGDGPYASYTCHKCGGSIHPGEEFIWWPSGAQGLGVVYRFCMSHVKEIEDANDR